MLYFDNPGLTAGGLTFDVDGYTDAEAPDLALRLQAVNGDNAVLDMDSGAPIPTGVYTILTIPSTDVAGGTIRRHSVTLTDGVMEDIVNTAYIALESEFLVMGSSADGTIRFHAMAEVVDRNP